MDSRERGSGMVRRKSEPGTRLVSHPPYRLTIYQSAESFVLPSSLGPQGREMIIRILKKMLKKKPYTPLFAKICHKKLTYPLTLDDWFLHIAQMEIAAMVIRQDIGSGGQGGDGQLARELLTESAGYGKLTFPVAYPSVARVSIEEQL
jgi:hypothetical protein